MYNIMTIISICIIMVSFIFLVGLLHMVIFDIAPFIKEGKKRKKNMQEDEYIDYTQYGKGG